MVDELRGMAREAIAPYIRRHSSGGRAVIPGVTHGPSQVPRILIGVVGAG